MGNNKKAGLADLKTGGTVNIGYTEENGAMVASHIKDLGANPPKPPKVDGHVPHKAGDNPNANLKHAHGIIDKIDTQAGAITIVARDVSNAGLPKAT